jgi:hypothetical protein
LTRWWHVFQPFRLPCRREISHTFSLNISKSLPLYSHEKLLFNPFLSLSLSLTTVARKILGRPNSLFTFAFTFEISTSTLPHQQPTVHNPEHDYRYYEGFNVKLLRHSHSPYFFYESRYAAVFVFVLPLLPLLFSRCQLVLDCQAKQVSKTVQGSSIQEKRPS